MTLTSTSSSLREDIRPHALMRWIVTAAVALATLPDAFAEPRFAVTELPIPAGFTSSSPYQINDQGFVVGASSRGDVQALAGLVATVWKGGKATVVGTLQKGTYSVASAINSKGTIAGEGDDGDGRPLGWVTSGSSLVNFFSNNGGNTRPVAISETGEIGGYYIKGFSSYWRGGIWKVDAKDPRKSTLVTLPIVGGSNPATASAIPFAFNKSLQAAGYVTNSDIGQHAAFWKNDAAHSVVDLGVFQYDWSSLAYSLNDLGQVVGSSHPPFGSRPVLWQNDAAHTAVELTLLPGDNYGAANLINSSGTIIGWSTYAVPGTWDAEPSKLVLWSGGQVYDLQTLIVAPGDSWTIVQVASINNLGQMAALAMRNGVIKAVVLTPSF